MTDRPTLARQCASRVLEALDAPHVDVSWVAHLIERVLAEHETVQAKGAIETMRDGEDLVVVQRKEYDTLQTAEARCAQVEQERDEVRDLADHIECDRLEATAVLTALQAEHERLRVALRDLIDAIPEPTLDDDPPLRSWLNIAEAALAPSQEPVT